MQFRLTCNAGRRREAAADDLRGAIFGHIIGTNKPE